MFKPAAKGIALSTTRVDPDRTPSPYLHIHLSLEAMELFLTHNNPERTVLVSPNGVAHYQITTTKANIFGAPRVSRIQRPAETKEDSIVAEIEWKAWGTQTLVRSNLLLGAADGVRARDFLYKRGPFSSYVSLYIVLIIL